MNKRLIKKRAKTMARKTEEYKTANKKLGSEIARVSTNRSYAESLYRQYEKKYNSVASKSNTMFIKKYEFRQFRTQLLTAYNENTKLTTVNLLMDKLVREQKNLHSDEQIKNIRKTLKILGPKFFGDDEANKSYTDAEIGRGSADWIFESLGDEYKSLMTKGYHSTEAKRIISNVYFGSN